MTVRVHPVILTPDSVTHYICDAGEQETHVPNTTHHMTSLNRCRYCHSTAGALRAEQEAARADRQLQH